LPFIHHPLQVKDVDFDVKQVMVRDGEWSEGHVVILPQTGILELRAHLINIRTLQEEFLRLGWIFELFKSQEGTKT
jgi:hypothetical protein